MLVGVSPAFAQLDVSIIQPATGATVGDGLYVVAGATFPPTPTITAKVDDRSITLTLSTHVGWYGTVNLKGLAAGEHTLVVEASNINGQKGQKQIKFIYDPSPVLTLTEPLQLAIGQPEIPLKGTCVDDKGICTVTVTATSTPSPQNVVPITTLTGGSFDTVITPPPGEQTLIITPNDATSSGLYVVRKVFSAATGGLSIEAAFQGTILDIDANRALTYDDAATPKVARLYDRAGNANQIIWTAGSDKESIEAGYLTPNNGALVVMKTTNDVDRLLEWRGGVLSEIAQGYAFRMSVKGAWAAFDGWIGPCCDEAGLYLRDLISGSNTKVVPSPFSGDYDVTPNGRVVFTSGQPQTEIRQFDSQPPPGATTTLLSSAPLVVFKPRSDGINVVFSRAPNGNVSPSIVLRTAAGLEEVLSTSGWAYLIAGGWTAFERRAIGGAVEIWLREPDGTLRQVTASDTNIWLEALSDAGDVVFTTFTKGRPLGEEQSRYLANADGTVRDLGRRPFGTVRFIGGAPYIVVGNELVAVDPTPAAHSILSEGATGTFFSTDVALLNPAATPVPVTVRYFREGLPELHEERTLPARSRTTIHLDDVQGLEGAAVSTQVDAPSGKTIVAERLMSWDATGYGGHLASAVDTPHRKWLFAEGAQGYFSTFFLLANGGTTEAAVHFKFLVEGGEPVDHTITVPAASRRTFYAGELAALVNRSFATTIEADVPIVAERAMYFGDSPLWLGGHGSAGVPTPAMEWYHAEGATGSLFDTFILLANPSAQATSVWVTFTTDTGVTVSRTKELPPYSRLTINIEDEAPELANAAVATRITVPSSGVGAGAPIVSERAMYWGTTGTGWREAHNSFGVTEAGPKWGLAEGRAGGDRSYQTYVLISNGTSESADIKLTFIREDGTAVDRTRTLPGGQRLNFNASEVPQLANSNFATIVESTNGVRINVESSIYWNAGGVLWEAGGNTVATPIP